MIIIEYLNEEIEGEPGPNFYWRGVPKDYIRLLNDMHVLGCEEDVEINLTDYPYIKLKGLKKVHIRSSSTGSFLCKRNGDAVIIDLTSSIWQDLLRYFLIISFYPSHYYVDFEDMNFIEDANFIISSEG